MTTKTSNLEAAAAMMDSVLALGGDAKQLALELYRQLALGEPCTHGVPSIACLYRRCLAHWPRSSRVTRT